ncbi:hypothetical protein RJ639_044258 [Escallonia herrerae]|uniref:RNase H type-1 domain-containing protein n=1 Tax=Escallonia herrerae TaxID=1293975 RepID=A0AA88WAN2_9ASTE|nr:hypothetical protein RJ639_044258 [Escallonia herrerae]
MYFDGASRNPDGKKQNDPKNNQFGIGTVFVTPEGGIILHSFSLTKRCSNNEAKYEVIIVGLELSLKVLIDDLPIYGDSKLIIKQLKSEYQIRKPNLLPYYKRADSVILKLQIRHAYWTTVRTSTRATPYALMFGSEAVLSLEVQIPSLCITIQESLTNEENVQIRLGELESLDEKRLIAQQNLEIYQQCMESAFNKRARVHGVKV